MKLCACGCGGEVQENKTWTEYKTTGVLRRHTIRYLWGHNTKGKTRKKEAIAKWRIKMEQRKQLRHAEIIESYKPKFITTVIGRRKRYGK